MEFITHNENFAPTIYIYIDIPYGSVLVRTQAEHKCDIKPAFKFCLNSMCDFLITYRLRLHLSETTGVYVTFVQMCHWIWITKTAH